MRPNAANSSSVASGGVIRPATTVRLDLRQARGDARVRAEGALEALDDQRPHPRALLLGAHRGELAGGLERAAMLLDDLPQRVEPLACLTRDRQRARLPARAPARQVAQGGAHVAERGARAGGALAVALVDGDGVGELEDALS